MIQKLIFCLAITLGFSITAIGAEQSDKEGLAKSAGEKIHKHEAKTNKDHKAEADEALKKVEAMTDKARGKAKGTEKKDDKK